MKHNKYLLQMSSVMEGNDFFLYSQHHHCWWLGDVIVYSHDIFMIEMEYHKHIISSFDTDKTSTLKIVYDIALVVLK